MKKQIIQKYQKKYKNTKEQFIEFVESKVEITEEQLNLVQKYLDRQKAQDQHFNENTLIKYLHVVAAARAGVDPRKLSQEQLSKHTKIKFTKSTQYRQKKQRQDQHDESQDQSIVVQLEKPVGQKTKAAPTKDNKIAVKGEASSKHQVSDDDDAQQEIKSNTKQPHANKQSVLDKKQRSKNKEQPEVEGKKEPTSNKGSKRGNQVEREVKKQVVSDSDKDQHETKTESRQMEDRKQVDTSEDQIKDRLTSSDEDQKATTSYNEKNNNANRMRQASDEKIQEIKRKPISKKDNRNIIQAKQEEKMEQVLDSQQEATQKLNPYVKEPESRQSNKQQVNKRVEQKYEKVNNIKTTQQIDKLYPDLTQPIAGKPQKLEKTGDDLQRNRNQDTPSKKPNQPEIVEPPQEEYEQIQIRGFQKISQEFMNPVIKYEIVYKDPSIKEKNTIVTWRRYSEFEKLMGYLRYRYMGVLLPEMPPKEGLTGSFNFVWKGFVNEEFLERRKSDLNQLLNRVLKCEEVKHDEVLLNFLRSQKYKVPDYEEGADSSYLQSLMGLKDIVFSYNQLKDYSVAYYKYLSEQKNQPLQTKCAKMYEQVQPLMQAIMTLHDYCQGINRNFEARRSIYASLQVKCQQPIKSQFQKKLVQAQIETKQLSLQYNRYSELKSSQSWLIELRKQKQEQGVTKLSQDLNRVQERVAKAQENLKKSIINYEDRNTKILRVLENDMIYWRKKMHP